MGETPKPKKGGNESDRKRFQDQAQGGMVMDPAVEFSLSTFLRRAAVFGSRPFPSMSVLFIDPSCESPYSELKLEEWGLDASEAAVVRVADGLARHGHRVTVAQQGRTRTTRSASGVRYVPYVYREPIDVASEPSAVVVLCQPKILPAVRRQFGGARLFLWLHEPPGSKRKTLARLAAETGATLITVSDSHNAELAAFLREHGDGAEVPVLKLYNPNQPSNPSSSVPAEPSKAPGHQQVEVRDPRAAARRLAAWYESERPTIAPRPAFRLDRLLSEWEDGLGIGTAWDPVARVA